MLLWCLSEVKLDRIVESETGQVDIEFSEVTDSEFFFFVKQGRKMDPACYDENRCFALAMSEFIEDQVEAIVVWF